MGFAGGLENPGDVGFGDFRDHGTPEYIDRDSVHVAGTVPVVVREHVHPFVGHHLERNQFHVDMAWSGGEGGTEGFVRHLVVGRTVADPVPFPHTPHTSSLKL